MSKSIRRGKSSNSSIRQKKLKSSPENVTGQTGKGSSFILGIDQGTTGSTAIIVNAKGQIVAKSNFEFQSSRSLP